MSYFVFSELRCPLCDGENLDEISSFLDESMDGNTEYLIKDMICNDCGQKFTAIEDGDDWTIYPE